MSEYLAAAHLAQQLGRTYRCMLAAFEQQVGHCLPRWRILVALNELQPCSQKQLVDNLPMDPGALTRQLKALQQQGWIERRTSELDNRQTLVCLTQSGQTSIEQALPKRSEFLGQLFAGMSADEMSQIQRQLQQLEQRSRDILIGADGE